MGGRSKCFSPSTKLPLGSLGGTCYTISAKMRLAMSCRGTRSFSCFVENMACCRNFHLFSANEKDDVGLLSDPRRRCYSFCPWRRPLLAMQTMKLAPTEILCLGVGLLLNEDEQPVIALAFSDCLCRAVGFHQTPYTEFNSIDCTTLLVEFQHSPISWLLHVWFNLLTFVSAYFSSKIKCQVSAWVCNSKRGNNQESMVISVSIWPSMQAGLMLYRMFMEFLVSIGQCSEIHLSLLFAGWFMGIPIVDHDHLQ